MTTKPSRLIALVIFSLFWIGSDVWAATQFDIAGPTASGNFGRYVTVLANGNFVVADPDFAIGNVKVGAVYLYNGRTGVMISSLSGSVTEGIGDQLGSGGVFALPNGNYVISSPGYSAGTELQQVGAVSFCDGVAGCSGIVGSGSMQGNYPGQRISGTGLINLSGGQTFYGITVLPNGDFVVVSPDWGTSSNTANSGAVTLCRAATGCPPTPTALNSLTGNRGDRAGAVGDAAAGALYNSIVPLTNGKYVVATRDWHLNSSVRAGAVTLCPANGCTGAISVDNSLVGTRDGDFVGASPGGKSVIDLKNGNYVVGSPYWTNPSGTGGMAAVGAGAATFCSGGAGCVGTVSQSNSLVGESANDSIGDMTSQNQEVLLLSNGNYVVTSPTWDNNGIANVGASVWCSGTAGCTGPVSGNQPLVGDGESSYLGLSLSGPVALTNGNYVMPSEESTTDAKGAVVFCHGATGCHGSISANVALVGTVAGRNVGSRVTALVDGNYVVGSPNWSNTADFAGAATWCDGTAGCSGNVTAANSLYGTSANDGVGSVIALNNGGYVLSTINWDNGPTAPNVGAVTFCGSATGCTGAVTAANSMVGSSANDRVGAVVPLDDGNYIIVSTSWNNAAVSDVGAVTWCSGGSGCVGTVSASNSLIGSTPGDVIGSDPNTLPTALPGGRYAFTASYFDNNGIVDAGAAFYGARGGSTGQSTTENSVRGTTTTPSGNGGVQPVNFKYDQVDQQLVVGRPFDNKVTIFRPTPRRTLFDFDGDGSSDLSVFRPSDANWYTENSSDNSFSARQWGLGSDKLAPADYDGDGKTDLAVFRDGVWWILMSANGQVISPAFGQSGDLPRPADLDGDGKADLCIFRPTAGIWYYRRSSDGQLSGAQFGQDGDTPMPADHDGDGKADLTVYRPSTGVWYVHRSSDGQTSTDQFGTVGDIPINGDLNGDGNADLAVFRPSNATWYVARTTGVPAQNFIATPFGLSGDIPVAADYDGDGTTDIAVYRAGQWWIYRSSDGQIASAHFGVVSDVPIASVFQQ